MTRALPHAADPARTGPGRRKLLTISAASLMLGLAGRIAPAGAAAVGSGVAQNLRLFPDTPFVGGDGRTRRLSDWADRPAIVNFYATWCAPCRQEMPSLDALARLRPGFAVLPISVERAGVQQLRQFYRQMGLHNLAVYQDPSGTLADAAGVWGYPTTVLVGIDGAEVDRVLTAMDWASPRALTWMDGLFGPGPKGESPWIPTKG